MGHAKKRYRVDQAHRAARKPKLSFGRRLLKLCGFESLESRQLLAADVRVGAVYYEEASGQDLAADRIEITFNGGPAGTQLTHLVIDTDKGGDGLTQGDPFIDTVAGGKGAFAAVPFSIVAQAGIDSVNVTLADGGQKLIFDFTGFDAGEKLIISLDFDEQGFFADSSSAVVEGEEFEGSKLTATFTAPHYFDLTDTGIFFDSYDLTGTGLNLPPDDYVPPETVGQEVRTAGTHFAKPMTPLPITIAGKVYNDLDLDNTPDAADPGIAGVTLTLLEYNGSSYVSTGKTTVTDANGAYKFEGLLPGQYRIVETQPTGYFSIGATAGNVGGSTRGSVFSTDIITDVSLLGGEDSVQNNFAEALPATLSGHVYHDADDDGVRDAGEAGIGGVSIEIQYLPPSGPAPAPIVVQTAADGSWTAPGLMPGNYSVKELQPAAYLDGKDKVGSAGGNLAPGLGDLVTSIALASGQVGIDYDFGELLPSSISGRVHADRDGDCEIDPGEPLLAGVTVYLLNAQGERIDQTLTNAQGEYEFTGLAPGVYGVEEITPDGYFDSGDMVGTAGGTHVEPDKITGIVLTSGTDGMHYDFCENEPVSIAGMVHADRDGDCVLDPGEIPLAGVTILLFNGEGQQVGQTTTDEMGQYKFQGLAPGEYKVVEQQPAGYYDGPDMVGSHGGTLVGPDTISAITLTPGVNAINYNFCELEPASLSGHVYADDNNNGVRDAGEAGIGGVLLTLLDAAGNPTGTTTTTDASGAYAFNNLTPGLYGVAEAQPSGYFDGKDKAGTAGGAAQNPGDKITGANLTPGTAGANYDFGELRPASVAGKVFADNDGDCMQDPGEVSLAGVTIHLLDAGGNVIATKQTDANGAFKFDNLAPGTYGLVEEQPAGYLDGGEMIGTAGGTLAPPDAIGNITLGAGVNATEYVFCEHLPASLSGYAYVDDNNNGTFDVGESPLAGVTLRLLNASGQPTGITTLTDASGFYSFNGLEPGVYGVAEDQPLGYFDGLDAAGSAGGSALNPGDRITGASLSAGQTGLNYNFGELRPASISGTVFVDNDDDCIFDAGEQPLGGVIVYLLDGAGNRINQTTTAADGTYFFTNLMPGTYGVEEQQPAGYLEGGNMLGSHGGLTVSPNVMGLIPLGSGVNAFDYNFCEVAQGTISGYVFQDGGTIDKQALESLGIQSIGSLRDGKRTPDDTPLKGVTLHLSDLSGILITDSNGNPLTAVTDANGYYEFKGLRPGVYAVIQSQPTGYVDHIDTAGTLGGLAINASTPADAIPQAFAGNFDAITGIALGAGQTSLENNFSEVVLKDTPGTPFFPENPPNIPPFPNAQAFAPQPGGAPISSAVPPITLEKTLLFGAGGVIPTDGYTWHLSVINAGSPRGDLPNSAALVQVRTPGVSKSEWMNRDLTRATWVLPGDTPHSTMMSYFGSSDAKPITGDWNGDGETEIGVFIDGQWYLDYNGNGQWDEGDIWAKLGGKGDTPVTGDWDGDGKTDIGIYGPAWRGDTRALRFEPGLPDAQNQTTGTKKNVPPATEEATEGRRVLKKTLQGNPRADLIDHVFRFGTKGDQAVSGDFNGDGIDNIGAFSGGEWLVDLNGDGQLQLESELISLGRPGDIAIVGDFNGDGIDEMGVFRNGRAMIDIDHNGRIDANDLVIEIGEAGDVPVVGDFNGDGVDEVGVYRKGRVVRK